MNELIQVLSQIHWLDASIVAALFLAAIVGARRGVIRQTMRLVAFVAAFYVSLALHNPFDASIRTNLQAVANEVSRFQSFVMVFVLTSMGYFVGKCLVMRMVKRLAGKKDSPQISDVPNLAWFDRCAGAAVAVVAVVALLGGGLIALAGVENESLQQRIAGSKLKPHVMQAVNALMYAVPEQSRRDFRNALERLERAGKSFLTDLAADGFQQGTRQIDSAAGHVELANRTLAAITHK